jgi:hypothetical protein
MRSRNKTVSFKAPFSLKGVDGPQPAGDYVIVTDEQRIDTMLFEAWRRVGTQIRLPSLGRDTGVEQYVSINAADLETAMLSDAGTVAAPSARMMFE